mmetsp:Transcript_35487/g.81910  ORF Transcript_35487/g.81910 Transcript_35487/m.81910 type:complete len:228 (+) Transcript_35487:53-736(+)
MLCTCCTSKEEEGKIEAVDIESVKIAGYEAPAECREPWHSETFTSLGGLERIALEAKQLRDDTTAIKDEPEPKGQSLPEAPEAQAVPKLELDFASPCTSMTFLTPCGQSETVMFTSRPLYVRFGQSWPLTVVAVSDNFAGSVNVKVDWVLTHVAGEPVDGEYDAVRLQIRAATKDLPEDLPSQRRTRSDRSQSLKKTRSAIQPSEVTPSQRRRRFNPYKHSATFGSL